MITWKCKDCDATARTPDERERGPLCSKTHHPLRMVRADEIEAGTPPVAGDEIVWRDPPLAPVGRGRDELRARFITALRGRPGAWALYPRTFKSNPTCGALAKRYPGTEWVGRRQADTKLYDLYGRWVGEAAASSAA